MSEQIPNTAGATAEPVKVRHFAFVVEVCGKNNENLNWPPDSVVLRGRWSKSNLIAASTETSLATLPDIPGMCINVNTQKRIVRRFDPLRDPKNEQQLNRIKRAVGGTFKKETGTEKPVVREKVGNDELKTVCYWVRRLLDSGMLREHGVQDGESRVPTIEQIKAMPGLVQLQTFDTRADVAHGTPNEKLRYKAPTPEEDRDREDDEPLPEPEINAEFEDD